jgi:hypothetical protein
MNVRGPARLPSGTRSSSRPRRAVARIPLAVPSTCSTHDLFDCRAWSPWPGRVTSAPGCSSTRGHLDRCRGERGDGFNATQSRRGARRDADDASDTGHGRNRLCPRLGCCRAAQPWGRGLRQSRFGLCVLQHAHRCVRDRCIRGTRLGALACGWRRMGRGRVRASRRAAAPCENVGSDSCSDHWRQLGIVRSALRDAAHSAQIQTAHGGIRAHGGLLVDLLRCHGPGVTRGRCKPCRVSI